MAKKKGVKKQNVKKAASKVDMTEEINNEVIAEALSSANQPVFLKVCRLCETKDGPFLNIFNPDMITAKKIETVMPFVITENDDLPHKICFRCSAKVEELYEFIQKCTQAQHNLRKAFRSKSSIATKPKHRELWEEKLNQSNISNDDICDALIKKAMEGIKDIPFNLQLFQEEKPIAKTVKQPIPMEEPIKEPEPKNEEESKVVPEKNVKQPIPKLDDVPVRRSMRSSLEIKSDTNKKLTTKQTENALKKDTPVAEIQENVGKVVTPIESRCHNFALTDKVIDKPATLTNFFSLEENESPTEKPVEKPFDIMDHVSMIKVNGVGVLFQCKLCNRNFLKKDIVMSHACAKNGPSKVQPKQILPPEPPKLSVVKYINTKINSDVKVVNDKPIMLDDDDDDDKPLATKKAKPKVGPASKVKRDTVSIIESPVTPNQSPIHVTPKVNSNVESPVVQFPTLPSLNSRYKLMPGPNNTYTLVEEKVPDIPILLEKVNTPEPVAETTKPTRPIIGPKRFQNKDKVANKPVTNITQPVPNITPQLPNNSQPVSNISQTVSNNSKPVPVGLPYPVGLFKSLQSANNNSTNTTIANTSAFSTPAMKKQSYTVVQTGNPSKLLISTKPQPVEEPSKKRLRKTKHEVRKEDKQPFSVTLEDTAPTRNTEFFTFINVDPLLQPSYVLPTDNIIQESQISTSTNVKQTDNNKDLKYTCNMCNETFSREKKLLAHIQLHYKKMDEEDQMRAKNPKKRKK